MCELHGILPVNQVNLQHREGDDDFIRGPELAPKPISSSENEKRRQPRKHVAPEGQPKTEERK
jgi:hypothetical protein